MHGPSRTDTPAALTRSLTCQCFGSAWAALLDIRGSHAKRPESLFRAILETLQGVLIETILSFSTNMLSQLLPSAQ